MDQEGGALNFLRQKKLCPAQKEVPEEAIRAWLAQHIVLRFILYMLCTTCNRLSNHQWTACKVSYALHVVLLSYFYDKGSHFPTNIIKTKHI